MSALKLDTGRLNHTAASERRVEMMNEYTSRYQREGYGSESAVGQFLIGLEEEGQRSVAESEQWLLANKSSNPTGAFDTRERLESFGFEIIDEDDLFYQVKPPEGWSKSTNGYWTEVDDADGKKQISQFYKAAFYDRDAFLIFTD